MKRDADLTERFINIRRPKMAEITAKMVKSLRDKTQLPMMECKKALQEADGDEEKAIEILRKSGKAKMSSRSDRETAEGRIEVYKGANGATAMIEIQCESAPVASNSQFIELAKNIAKQLAEGPGASTPEELLAQGDLQLQYDDLMNKIREVFKIPRILRVEGNTGVYVHHDFKTGVVVEFEGDNFEVANQICMQVCAMNPRAVSSDDLDPEVLKKEREIAEEQTRVANAGKPDNIIAKIVEGRLKAVLKEICLVDQQFIMDSNQTVADVAKAAGIKVKKFHRWGVGL